jgi:Holliday junction resolvase RusA-like endonuclease
MTPDDRPDYFERKFIVDIVPIKTTHQSDLRILKAGDGRMFVGKTTKSAIKAWMKEFELKAKKYIPDKPYTGPIEMTLYFGFPNVIADKGKTVHMATRPDFDNLAKAVTDSLTNCGFWYDDCQIVFGKVMKFRTDKPFLGVWIKPAEHIDSVLMGATIDHLSK